MIEWKRVDDVDDELYQFCLRQKDYYRLENRIVTKENLREDMNIPEGFDQLNHYCYKIYIDHQFVAYMDNLYGYRYPMKHDDSYVWVGLFLVDQKNREKGYGKQIFENFIEHLDSRFHHIQLACIHNNEKGLGFWQSLGFVKGEETYCGKIPVIVFQYDL